MKHPILTFTAIMGFIAAPAIAQAPPADGQCRASATQATGYTPTSAPTGPDGSRAAGAARGAVVGGVVNGDEGARNGAAADMVVAESRKRRARRGERRSADQRTAWQSL